VDALGVPRLAVPILYGVALWSFLTEIIGSSITSNHWLTAFNHRDLAAA
jgi:hypothetical protein